MSISSFDNSSLAALLGGLGPRLLGASNFLAGIPGRLRGLLALAFHRMLAPWGSGGAIKTISIMVEFSCLLKG